MLSDKRILEEMAKGNIVIDPFDKRQLGTNSYDCRLGEYFYREHDEQGDGLYLFSEEMRHHWLPLRRAKDGFIPIDSGELILAHTLEKIGGRGTITSKMYTRSTAARSGIDVCSSSGLGDVGFTSHFTLEIRNRLNTRVWLPVGARICQVAFMETGETLKDYKGTGNYGQEHEWSQLDMLPKVGDWAVDEWRESEQGNG